MKDGLPENERARRYRARAEDCLRLAQSGTLPDCEAQHLRYLAECYSEALAEEKRAVEQHVKRRASGR